MEVHIYVKQCDRNGLSLDERQKGQIKSGFFISLAERHVYTCVVHGASTGNQKNMNDS